MAGFPSDRVITGVADVATHDNGAPGGRRARTNNNEANDKDRSGCGITLRIQRSAATPRPSIYYPRPVRAFLSD